MRGAVPARLIFGTIPWSFATSPASVADRAPVRDPIEPDRRHGEIDRFSKAIADGADLMVDAADLAAEGRPARCLLRWARPGGHQAQRRPLRRHLIPVPIITLVGCLEWLVPRIIRSTRAPRNAVAQPWTQRHRCRITNAIGRCDRGRNGVGAIRAGAPEIRVAWLRLGQVPIRPVFVKKSSVSSRSSPVTTQPVSIMSNHRQHRQSVDVPFTISRAALTGNQTNDCNFVLTFN